MPVPNTFANATATIPLSQLDANFATTITLGNTAIQLGNTVTTLNNMTFANATITSGNVTITNVTVTTANVTTANIATAVITTANVTTANITTGNVSGNLTFTSTGNRITGDFSNATVANRVTFQSSTTNGNTTLSSIPNGTAAGSGYRAYNASDPTNSAYAWIAVSSLEASIISGITGTGTYLPMTFYTGGSECMRLDSSGNLGLGVTPSAWGSTYKVAQVGNGGAVYGRNNSAQVGLSSNYYNDGTDKYLTTAAATAYVQSAGKHLWYNAPSGTAGNAITFTQAMTLDASGQLGIGTTSPTTKLHLAAAGDVGGKAVNSATTGSATFNVTNNSGSIGQLMIYGSAQGAYGALGSGEAALYCTTSTTLMVDNVSGVLKFTAGGNAERARITSGGDFYVGDTNNTLGNTRLYIKGDGTNPASRIWANTSTTSVYGLVVRHESTTAGAYIQFVTDSNVETGRIYDLAGTMQYASSSDARLKTNVQPMQNSLQSVLALNPCTFDMRRGEDTFIPSAGLIAQEVHEVYPFVVGVGGDDENTNPWSVDYGKLTPLLVAAIKELNAKVEAQAAEIAALKGNA